MSQILTLWAWKSSEKSILCSLTTETGHISPAVWLPVGAQRVSPGKGSSVGWVWWAGHYSADSDQALALRMRRAMTPCPSPDPQGSPDHPCDTEKRRQRADRRGKLGNDKRLKKKYCVRLCVSAHFSNLIRVHEELNKLTANNSELSGLYVIQCKPCIQFTTRLIKVQQPPHKPASHRRTVFQTIYQKTNQTIENVAVDVADYMTGSYLCICSSLLFLRFTFGHWERNTTFKHQR